MTVYLAALGAGLGDVAVLLPVVQSLIAEKQRVVFVARSRMQSELMSLVPGLAGVISQPDFQQQQPGLRDRYLDFAAHPIMRMADTDWQQFKKTYPETQINEFIHIICAEHLIQCDLDRLQPLPFETDERTIDKLLLIPGTTSDSKAWPRSCWLDLIENVKRNGRDAVMIGKQDSPPVRDLIQSGLTWLPTPTIQDALNALSSAWAIVAVDTGLMHLSVHQSRPTVSFCNRASFWRRKYFNLTQLVTRPCATKCAEHGLQVDAEHAVRPQRFYDDNVWTEEDFYFCRVSEEERCISSIMPAEVLDALSKLSLAVRA